MNSFSELSGKAKAIELLRWVGVLPAAVLGRLVVDRIVGAMLRRTVVPDEVVAPPSYLVNFLQILILYPPMVAVFVIAGAMTAPRSRRATAIVLAVLAIALSLTIHVLLPDHVGVNNYKHLAAEAVGAVVGAVFVFYSERKRRPCE